MHHGPEMSSVSLLIQPSSITPTLTPGRDEEEGEEGEMRIGWKKTGRKEGRKGEISEKKGSMGACAHAAGDVSMTVAFVRDHTYTTVDLPPKTINPSVVFGIHVSHLI